MVRNHEPVRNPGMVRNHEPHDCAASEPHGCAASTSPSVGPFTSCMLHASSSSRLQPRILNTEAQGSRLFPLTAVNVSSVCTHCMSGQCQNLSAKTFRRPKISPSRIPAPHPMCAMLEQSEQHSSVNACRVETLTAEDFGMGGGGGHTSKS